MKRSLFAIAAIACLSAVSAASSAVTELAVYTWQRAKEVGKAVFFGPVNLTVTEVDEQQASPPRVALRRAGQFVLRLLKRERPEVTPDWRLVPST